MNAPSLSQRTGATSQTTTGWLVSCLLHGSLVLAAVLFVERIQLAPQPEPFTWNVAMVMSSPASTASPTEQSAPSSQVNPMSATPARPSPPPESASRLVTDNPQERIDAPASPAHAPAPVAPAVEKPMPPPVTSIEQPAKEPPPPVPANPELLREPVPDQVSHSSVASENVDPMVKQLDAPPAPPPVVGVSAPPHAQATSSQAVEETPVLPAVQSVSTATRGPTVDMPAHRGSVEPVDAAAPRGESAPIHHEPPTPQHPTMSPQVASFAPAGQPKSAKPDYGWLAEQMTRWIEDLDKRYPAVLRTEGVQGKVTLTAVLHEDGLLTDVRVAKSSGHAVLDQVALEDVKKGPPVKLSRALDKPQIPVKFSIVYDLKTVQ